MSLFRRKEKEQVVKEAAHTAEIRAVSGRLDKVERRVKLLEQTVQVYKREV